MSPSVLARTNAEPTTPPAPRTATLHACGCGQELDTCHAGHCPRCGVTLRA